MNKVILLSVQLLLISLTGRGQFRRISFHSILMYYFGSNMNNVLSVN